MDPAPSASSPAVASSSTASAAGAGPSSRVALAPFSVAQPHSFTDAQLSDYKEQDRFLPIANVSRIMKDALPTSAKIAKDAKECMQECVSEFISFITSEASDRCRMEKRKTLNGEDILNAMTDLGFDNYIEALRPYLAKYRISQSAKPKKSGKAAGSSKKRPRTDGEEGDEDEGEEADDGDGEGEGGDDDEDGSGGGGEDGEETKSKMRKVR